MINAVKIGLSGLIAASSRMEVAANNIVTAGARASNFSSDLSAVSDSDALQGGSTYAPERPAPTSRPGGGLQASSIASEHSGGPSFAENIANIKMAETAYKANLEVIRTASDMQKRLIDEIDI